MYKTIFSLAALAVLSVGIIGCSDDNNDTKTTTQDQTQTQNQDQTQTQDQTQDQTQTQDQDLYASKSTSIAYPTTDAQKRNINVASKIDLKGKTESLSYKTILRTNDQLSGEIFGQLKDENDQPLKLEDGSNYICNGQFGGSGPDHTEFIKKGDKLYMITQFECQVGAIYMAELSQDQKTGELKAENLKFISQKDYHGGYVHCAGMKTPWNTFLGSEEYEPDAKKMDENGSINKYYDAVAPYFGGDLKKANPYFYGWITEVSIDNDGEANYTKHYSMGRFAHELAYVMPDKKTVYLSDDGTNCGFFMYVADTAGDLSAGTLYAAKWHQTSDKGAGAANLEWIKLGHTKDNDIKQIVDKKVTFDTIFDATSPKKDGTCACGFTHIHTGTGEECLKVKEGMDTRAAFLETRRYAAIKGATTEFRKMEGLTYNTDQKVLYTAISQIAKGMEDHKKYGKPKDSYDKGGNNDIKLTYDKCGAVYALDIDESNTTIIKVKNMHAIVAGTPKSYPKDSIYANNTCDINGISSPDNITYLPGSHTLLIGEDTGYHQTDLIWSFDTNTNKLKDRVASTPYGSETTSAMWQPNINGFTYINFVTQHPYGESDKDKIKNPSDVQSYVGYMQAGGKK